MSSAIPGDPAGMRAKAAVFRLRAEQVSSWAERLGRQVDRMEFVGPAADRFRERMRGRRQALVSVARELSGLAELLLRSAAEVEARQLAEARRLRGAQARR